MSVGDWFASRCGIEPVCQMGGGKMSFTVVRFEAADKAAGGAFDGGRS